jgi:hypothetical protein
MKTKGQAQAEIEQMKNKGDQKWVHVN